jgi:hypothetical protein
MFDIKKYSQAAINRKRKFEQAQAPRELRLHDFVHKKRVRSMPTVNLKVGKAVCSLHANIINICIFI